MLEIKFRAWDIAYKLYRIVDGNNLFIADNEIYDYDCSRSPEMKYVTKDYILEQFTGLNDKNGVEIYEGDIVLHDKDPYPQIIEWDKEQTGYVCGCWCGSQFSTGKVIGNIHENPELLKQNGDVGND